MREERGPHRGVRLVTITSEISWWRMHDYDITVAIIGGTAVIITAILKFVPMGSRNDLWTQTTTSKTNGNRERKVIQERHDADVDSTLENIRQMISDGVSCKAGTTETCLKHSESITKIETILPEVRKDVASVKTMVEGLDKKVSRFIEENVK
jgi:hypothetical protein